LAKSFSSPQKLRVVVQLDNRTLSVSILAVGGERGVAKQQIKERVQFIFNASGADL